jgi:uncharacterized membrane-anchored protein YjiN (DUF445 family)
VTSLASMIAAPHAIQSTPFFRAPVVLESSPVIDARDLRLRAMKRRATALLLLVVLLYIAAIAYQPRLPWLAYVAAAAEAGIVGALADWFAVVALFHHPFNLAIPHTRIIPRNRARFARQLGEFIQREFLSPELVVMRIREFNPALRLIEWLVKPENVGRIADYASGLFMYALTAIDDARVRHFLQEAIGNSVREADLSSIAGTVLDVLTYDDRHQALLDAALAAADDVLAQEDTRAFIAGKLAQHFWVLNIAGRLGLKVNERTAQRVLDVALNLLSEVRNDRKHELRQRFDEATGRFIARLKTEGGLRLRVEAIKREALEEGAVRRYVEALWTELRGWLAADLKKDDSAIRAHMAAAVQFLGRQLHEDKAVQDWINEQILIEAPPFIKRYRADIARFVEDQVNSWTSEKLVTELERSIGPDLQYIRINGTIVGAAAGLAIYALTQFLLTRT